MASKFCNNENILDALAKMTKKKVRNNHIYFTNINSAFIHPHTSDTYSDKSCVNVDIDPVNSITFVIKRKKTDALP